MHCRRGGVGFYACSMMQGAKVEADTLRMQMGTDKVTLITPDTHRRVYCDYGPCSRRFYFITDVLRKEVNAVKFHALFHPVVAYRGRTAYYIFLMLNETKYVGFLFEYLHVF